MKTTTLTISPDIFKQMIAMLPDDMSELVETVGVCASLNGQLAKLPTNKIAVGISMLRHAMHILEQCDCKIQLKIHNNTWTGQVDYTTNNNTMGEVQ